jgi:hypothetical protein
VERGVKCTHRNPRNPIVERGAPATAIHVRDILKQIYGFSILHGEKVANPADDVGPASIATFVPKDRSLSTIFCILTHP